MKRRLAASLPALAAAVVCMSGCSVFKTNEEAQVQLNARATGMSAGDFFQQYGTWKRRVEQSNGGAFYFWESAVGSAPAGPLGQDDRVCRLNIVVNKAGRIETATIVNDNPGAVSTSRCGEMFKNNGTGAAIPSGVRP